MTLRLTEYAGFQSGRPLSNGIPIGGLIQSQSLTISATVSTAQLSPGTYVIFVDADAGALLSYGSSTSTNTPTSSNSQHIAANTAPVRIEVKPNSKVFVLST